MSKRIYLNNIESVTVFDEGFIVVFKAIGAKVVGKCVGESDVITKAEAQQFVYEKYKNKAGYSVII